MRLYLTLVVSFCLMLSGCQTKSYLTAGDACFDKGDYDCARQNYTAHKSSESGGGIDKKIEVCNTCMETLALAEFFFMNKDYQNAKEKYEELLKINAKDPRAKVQIGLCIEQLEANGLNPEIDEAAQQYAMGSSLFSEKNYTEAAEWYRKSAEQGNADGQASLGYVYNNGYGVAKDDDEAIKWYRKSAEQGNAVGQVNLGYMYRNGFGVAQDYAEAAIWYRKSAEQGNTVAQRNLGLLYESGNGVAQDYAEAITWYRKSAEQGDADGHIALGNMYFGGRGVEVDYTEAFNHFRISAAQNNVMGQYNLGLMYEGGLGVSQDKDEAIKWYTKAAEQGHERAQKAVERLSSN